MEYSIICYHRLDQPSEVLTLEFDLNDPKGRQLAREVLGEVCLNLGLIHVAKATELGLPLLLQVRVAPEI